MRSTRIVLSGIVALMGTAAFATHYDDAINDVSSVMAGYGNPNADIASVDITNDNSLIAFKITCNSSDIISPDWIKLNVIIRKVGDAAASLDTSANGNGWIRPYNMAGGASRFIGGWLDGGGGFEARTYNPGLVAWDLQGATYNATPGMSIQISGNTATFTTPLSALNLKIGDTFYFDAVTTGGYSSDGAWDALSSAVETIANPGDPFTVAGNLTYRVSKTPSFSAGSSKPPLLALGMRVVPLEN